MKYLSSILAAFVLLAFTGVLVAHAVEPSYTPLAPLPGTTEGAVGAETTNLSLYLSGMIKLLIALGGAFSILMAIIGGTQYVAAGVSPDAKSGAKERIQNALVGLALVLTSYLILNSISPNLVKFNFMLPPVGVAPGVAVAPTVVQPTEGAWPSDDGERAALLPVTVNKSNCTVPDATAPGGTSCTSVSKLESGVITKIKQLQIACNCSVEITAGTEWWLHRSHNNNRNVDLHKDGGTLDAYITKTGVSSVTACGVKSDTHYQTDGATYVDEPNRDAGGNITGTGRHWHVCY